MSYQLPRTKIIERHGFDLRLRTKRTVEITMSDDMAECLAQQIFELRATMDDPSDGEDLRAFAALLDELLT